MRTCFALLMLLVVFNAVAQKNPEKLTFELRLAGVKSGEAFYQTNIESRREMWAALDFLGVPVAVAQVQVM